MKRFGFVRKESTAHSFKKLFSFFMLSFLLLLSACGKEAEKTEAPAEALLLRNGYYTVSDEDGSLKYYWRIKDDQLTVYNPDGSWSDELRLLYDAKNEEYTIEEEKTVFTLRERKDGLQIRTGSGERYMLAKISKDAMPDPAQVTSAAPTESAPLPVQDLRIVTGGVTGTSYSVGVELSVFCSRNTPLRLECLPGAGSQGNIYRLADKEEELAICRSDVMTYAYFGTKMFENDGQLTNFSVLTALYPEFIQLVAVNPDIKTVFDLKGKNVSVGDIGSTTYYAVLDILAAYDMKLEDIKPIYRYFADSANDLNAGTIDASFLVASAPIANVTELATTNRNTHLVVLDEAHIRELVNTAPYFAKAVIPAGTYATAQARSVATVAVSTAILVRSDIDEETVYQLTKTIFDHLPELGLAHPVFRDLTPEYGASIVTVPYHRGAARYFEGLGIFVGVSP